MTTLHPARISSPPPDANPATFARWRQTLTNRPIPLDGLLAALAYDTPSHHHTTLASDFWHTLPTLTTLANHPGQEFPQGIPLLLPGTPATVRMSRRAAAGLGVHMLLGTLPDPRSLHRDATYNSFDRVLADPLPSTVAKLQSWLLWLTTAATTPPTGWLTIERRVGSTTATGLPTADDWAACDRPLTPLTLAPDGMGIEEAVGCLQVDFANRFPGGGTLGRGCVQEELRFAMSPELLMTMLLAPAMRDDEVVRVFGAAQVARIDGYGWSARYAGPAVDPAPRDAEGTPQVEVVVMDALPFRQAGVLSRQLDPATMLRELGKAWVGFHPSDQGGAGPVATGNWGCGVFGGHLPLKALLQWMAASWHGRPVQYHPFGDQRLGDLAGFATTARAQGWTVGRLWQALDGVSKTARSGPSGPTGQGAPLADGRTLYQAVLDRR